MPKFTSAERVLVKSIIAALSIKRIPEQDIIDEIYRQTNKTITKSGLFYIRKDIKKESYQWYKTMREGEYEYIHEFRERINEILDLQKRHYEIAGSPTVPIPIKQASLFELHKLTVTLSNLFDVAPYITSTGNLNNNATLSTPSEVKTTGSEKPISYVV
jgi:hypothetical protein